MRDIIVVGGGLGGLVSSILLNRKGFRVLLIEKKAYPFHRVCGEYISNETLPFLKKEGLLPNQLDLPSISQFQFTSIKGRSLEFPLDLGGFGLSRYTFDHHLFQIAEREGVEVWQKTSVSEVCFLEDHFELTTEKGAVEQARTVLGAYGKKSNLDLKLERKFTKERSPFLGVKYHIRTDFPKDQISLHNFKNGYCGISAIEDGKYNLCYLGSREDLRKYGSIDAMEEATVKQNPFLKSIYNNSDFLFEKPEVINEFSFKPKELIEDHVLMLGDAAGLITPLCGNGMAMAIHSAKILSDVIGAHLNEENFSRDQLEKDYRQRWNQLFQRRLWIGRNTQKLFGAPITSELAVFGMKTIPNLAKTIMKGTHGKPFQ